MIEIVLVELSLYTDDPASLVPHLRQQLPGEIAGGVVHTLVGSLTAAWILCRACRRTLRVVRRRASGARRLPGAGHDRCPAGCGHGKRRRARSKRRRCGGRASNRGRCGKGGSRDACVRAALPSFCSWRAGTDPPARRPPMGGQIAISTVVHRPPPCKAVGGGQVAPQERPGAACGARGGDKGADAQCRVNLA